MEAQLWFTCPGQDQAEDFLSYWVSFMCYVYTVVCLSVASRDCHISTKHTKLLSDTIQATRYKLDMFVCLKQNAIPYSGKVWQGESLANLANHP